jgi:hypothetical protein
LLHSNRSFDHPFSFEAGVLTCLGVQSQTIILTPDQDQVFYKNSVPSEIGMNQCFGGKSVATIYPYVSVSFNTFGSSQADSLFLCDEITVIGADVNYRKPK